MSNDIYRAVGLSIIGIGIAISGYFIGQGAVNFREAKQYISVKGLSENKVLSDKAIWSITYKVKSLSLNGLYKQSNLSQGEIKQFLTTNKIKSQNIQINSSNITSNTYDNCTNVKTKYFNKQTGEPIYDKKCPLTYYQTGIVTVTSDDVLSIQKISQEINKLVENNVYISNSKVNYKYMSLNIIKPKMIEEATEDAKQAGEKFAHNTNMELTTLKEAYQSPFSIMDSNGDNDSSDVYKIVRVVVNMQYYFK